MTVEADGLAPVLAFDEVSFDYPTGQRALENVTFRIQSGELVAVVGANGSGKSTLARLSNGLLYPTRGQVRVAGQPTRSEPGANWAIRRQVGLVFQHPDNQLVAATVEEDVAFGPENLGLPPPLIRERVEKAMAQVGIQALRERAPHQLSGGQKQLVAIAGILAMEPLCIILDEATAMLDPAGARQVMEVLRQLHREQGLTVVHITHEMAEVAMADRVLVLHQGRLVADEPPHQLFQRGPALEEWGLEVPDLVALAQRLREAGWPLRPPQRGSVQEMVEVLWPLLSAG